MAIIHPMILLHFCYPVFHSGALRQLTLNAVCLLLLALSSANNAHADVSSSGSTGEAKPIEVYPLSQNFYDVAAGDTLQQIVLQLLPNRPDQREHLMQAIVKLNPTAFVKHNPSRLKAHVRLWLPNSPPHSVPQLETRNLQIESFSWGQVIRRRQD